jgi:isopentenyl diphosphate isomerase/L-lactate dehydrogenase-like FMN-dependent dehydrogenase
LKGIMNVRDAALAVEAGAHAIIVSNHGGRVLDEMAGTMDVIEEIVREVKGYIRIMIDGGFRNGVDILKALALGAEYVLIGRPVGIAAVGMGAKGVSFYFDNLKKDLCKAMILTGCASVSDITPTSCAGSATQYQHADRLRISSLRSCARKGREIRGFLEEPRVALLMSSTVMNAFGSNMPPFRAPR